MANDAIRALLRQVGEDSAPRVMLMGILAEGEEHAHDLDRLM